MLQLQRLEWSNLPLSVSNWVIQKRLFVALEIKSCLADILTVFFLLMIVIYLLKHATLLLDAAIEDSQWELAQDLVRFLKAIGMWCLLI